MIQPFTRSKAPGKLDLLVLAIVFLVGLVHLSYPFDGDQALFTVGASEMSRGAVLYRDFWDLKQPAIFGFYLVAGRLFGFNEPGIHLFELLYLVAFSATLQVTLKSYYEHPALASLAPLLTVGAYYGISGSWHLTQVEGLVGFPVFVSLWFASTPARDGRRAARFFLSGLAGGLVLLFKFLFLPLLLAFWLAALVELIVRGRERAPVALAWVGAPVAAGVLCSLLIAFGYFAWHGALGIIAYTYFEYPTRAVAELQRPDIGRLLSGLQWFTVWAAPFLALGSVGVWASLSKRMELLTVNLVLWLLAGFCVIFIQRFSWWEYHYLLLLFPLGLLAAKGLDGLWGLLEKSTAVLASRKARAAATLCVALLFLPVLAPLALKGVSFTRAGLTLQSERRLQYRSKISRQYRTALSEVAFLSEPGNLPGDIYVCGNPLFYYLSGRHQAIASNGWMLELFLSEQWAQMADQLSASRPPYIFIASEYSEMIPERAPQTSRLLEENYRVLRRGDAGVWYVLEKGSHQSTH